LQQALNLKLNYLNYGMPQKLEDTYFKKIGCSGKEITPNLLNQFGTTFCRMQKKARYDLDVPIVNRPYYQAVLREVDLSDELLQLIPKALDILLEEERECHIHTLPIPT
jgi:hypothetical protein